MNEREAHVQEVCETVHRVMEGTPSPDFLVYATGLLLGVRSVLVTLEEWQRWGVCAAALLWARYEADAAAATPPGETRRCRHCGAAFPQEKPCTPP